MKSTVKSAAMQLSQAAIFITACVLLPPNMGRGRFLLVVSLFSVYGALNYYEAWRRGLREVNDWKASAIQVSRCMYRVRVDELGQDKAKQRTQQRFDEMMAKH